jgi:phosphoribosyl 1,2-cyclic phosphodiesterase
MAIDGGQEEHVQADDDDRDWNGKLGQACALEDEEIEEDSNALYGIHDGEEAALLFGFVSFGWRGAEGSGLLFKSEGDEHKEEEASHDRRDVNAVEAVQGVGGKEQPEGTEDGHDERASAATAGFLYICTLRGLQGLEHRGSLCRLSLFAGMIPAARCGMDRYLAPLMRACGSSLLCAKCAEYGGSMVRMTVLASGSRGNCTVVTAGRTSVLVDAGVSCREILKRMAIAGEDPTQLDAILITHEHQDHVQGLSVLARRLGIPVFFTEATHRAWMRWMVPQKRMTYADWLATRKAEVAAKAEAARLAAQIAVRDEDPAWGRASASVADLAGPDASRESASTLGLAAAAGPSPLDEANPFYREAALAECAEEQAVFAQGAADEVAADPCALPRVEYFEAGKAFTLGDLRVTPFTIPHDAVDPVGFCLEGEGMRLGLATDLGYMPANVSHQLRLCDVLMLESNHDLDMLRDGPYPWSVKQRVLSRVGHLSNTAAAEFLETGYDGQAAYVVLAHLSSSNNLPELARVAAEWALRERMQLLANRVVVAAQDEPTASIFL